MSGKPAQSHASQSAPQGAPAQPGAGAKAQPGKPDAGGNAHAAAPPTAAPGSKTPVASAPSKKEAGKPASATRARRTAPKKKVSPRKVTGWRRTVVPALHDLRVVIGGAVALGYLVFLVLLWRDPAPSATTSNRKRTNPVAAIQPKPPIPPVAVAPLVQPPAPQNEEKADARAQGAVESRRAQAPQLIWPTAGREITSRYGARVDPVSGIGIKRHRGLDVRSECGTPVVSVAAGKVIFAGYTKGSGNVVKVKHDDMTTRYAHLSELSVTEGQHIGAGEQLGLSGATGRTTGPHLHFEIWTRKGPRNPLSFRYRHLPANTFARSVRGHCGQSLYASTSEGDLGWTGADILPQSSSLVVPGDDALQSFLQQQSSDLTF